MRDAYDLDELDDPEKKMLRRMFDLLRPFLAGCGLLPQDFTLLRDEAGVILPDDGRRSFDEIIDAGASSGLSGIFAEPLLLSSDIARTWVNNLVRWMRLLCIEVMLVESSS